RAYPVEAGLLSLRRTVRLGDFAVEDEYKFKEFRGVEQSFMTVCKVALERPGVVVFTTEAGRRVEMSYDPSVWGGGRVEKVEMGIPEEENVRVHWRGKAVYRVVLVARRKPGKVRFGFK
ncbi:MAG TPA: hypothetical protein VI233_02130, partial [Puia sp.]